MTTSELLEYIKKQIKNNIPKELIVSKLLSAGWYQEDIDEGFLSVDLENKLTDSIDKINEKVINIEPQIITNNNEDKYREPVIENKVNDILVEQSKVEVLGKSIPKTEPSMDAFTPKVWTPKRVPVVDVLPPVEVSEVKSEIIQPQPQAEPIKIEEPTKEELIPTLKPKIVVDNTTDQTQNIQTNKGTYIPSNEASKNYAISDLPKMAMLSSYEKDLQSVSGQIIGIEDQKRRNPVKWIILAVIIFIIAGAVWSVASGYINLDKFNFSFIKKDPKVLLLNNSKVLLSLPSYKTETNINITSPSFSNISAGLIGGEAVDSLDKDYVSINTLGVVNRVAGNTGDKVFLSDNFITIKSSLLRDSITTDIKNNGRDLFVSVPDLSQIIGENAPEPLIVKINESESDITTTLFSANIGARLKKINLYKVLSGGMSSYINEEIISSYNELINSMEVVEKGQENIKGVDTYHYSINADRQSIKNFLTTVLNNFSNELSDQDKNQLNQIIGSVTVASFDIWIGKDNGNIYQYNVIADIPLSKIIGFEDKSIGDNKVSVEWKTTYYDFGVQNEIFIPDGFTSVSDFEKIIFNMKIKNSVSSFKQLATNLFNAEGSYGKKSNISGSCMNPASGSLFSPVGHAKGALSSISSISGLLSRVMKETNEIGLCYSTPKSWSFSLPVSSIGENPVGLNAQAQSFICIDNTGVIKNLEAAPTGPICK
jgi:hypothetical protein